MCALKHQNNGATKWKTMCTPHHLDIMFALGNDK